MEHHIRIVPPTVVDVLGLLESDFQCLLGRIFFRYLHRGYMEEMEAVV